MYINMLFWVKTKTKRSSRPCVKKKRCQKQETVDLEVWPQPVIGLLKDVQGLASCFLQEWPPSIFSESGWSGLPRLLGSWKSSNQLRVLQLINMYQALYQHDPTHRLKVGGLQTTDLEHQCLESIMLSCFNQSKHHVSTWLSDGPGPRSLYWGSFGKFRMRNVSRDESSFESHCLVVPSITKGFGLVVFQAQLFGVWFWIPFLKGSIE